nr:GATA-type zinc finger protein 1 isoform X2 [Jaculus jaculus]
MEDDPPRHLVLLQELLVPPCLDPESPPESRLPIQMEPRTLRCLRPRGRSLWPACQDSVTALPSRQEKDKGLTESSSPVPQALGTCWELVALGTSVPLNMSKNSKNTKRSVIRKYYSLEPPGVSPASPQRRPRKQPNPRMGTEKVDPGFKGVTLEFQIQPDSSLQIVPTYSLPSSNHAQESPTSPTRDLGPSPGSSEALEPRRCASCRTQRTPLWRDAEDGTPLCNACGIRYKKYGTRCSSCWLVPRKSVQPKRLCGRCGVSLDPHKGPTEEM